MADRGLTLERAEKYRLGFVGEPLPGHDQFQSWLAIPYLRRDQTGGWAAVSIRFRCIEQHEHQGHGKYMTVAGDRPRIFNTLELTKPHEVMAITEGELDAVMSTEAGLPAVGLPGAESWQPHFREPFLGYDVVYVITDGDDAGRKFGNTIGKTLPNSRVVGMPPGLDVNDFIVKEGVKAFRERIGIA